MGTNSTDGMVYFAISPDTGEIWEDTNFRWVYNAVRASLKAHVYYSKYYEYLSVVIYYGVVINGVSGHFEPHAFRAICRITISGICGKISMNQVEKMGV